MSEAESRLLDAIYEAAMFPELWTDLLDHLSDYFKAGPINVGKLDLMTGLGDIIFSRADPLFLSEYENYYASINPVLIISDIDTYKSKWYLDVLTDEDMIDRDIFLRTEYYNDHLLSMGADRLVTVRLSLDRRKIASLTMSRTPGRDGFSRAEVESLRRIQPHLVRAFHLSERLLQSGSYSGALLDAEGLNGQAVMLVDASGRIGFKNRDAEILLTEGDGLTAIGGALAARRPEDSLALKRLFELAHAVEPGFRTGGALSIRRAGKSALNVHVSPLRSAVLSLFSRSSAALVCVDAVTRAQVLSPALLKRQFDLTEAESRLAGLLREGLSLDASARRLGVSRHTVRAQLGAVFTKTGVHRQAELVLLLAGLTES